MKRELKRGEVFRAKDGTIYEYAADGRKWRMTGKRREAHEDGKGNPMPLVFEVSDDEYAKNPSIWVPPPEEVEKVKAEALAKEEAWWKARGKDLPDNLRAKMAGPAPENKMVEPPEEKRRGRPRMEVKG